MASRPSPGQQRALHVFSFVEAQKRGAVKGLEWLVEAADEAADENFVAECRLFFETVDSACRELMRATGSAKAATAMLADYLPEMPATQDPPPPRVARPVVTPDSLPSPPPARAPSGPRSLLTGADGDEPPQIGSFRFKDQPNRPPASAQGLGVTGEHQVIDNPVYDAEIDVDAGLVDEDE